MTHTDVVAAFNELGYTASFAAVRNHLFANDPTTPPLDSLYRDYPSREVLAEHWLSELIPPSTTVATLREAFTGLVSDLLDTLEGQRDFSRAWLASMTLTGPLHLPELQRLHDRVKGYFVAWLEAHQTELSLPGSIPILQAKEDIADALCAVVFWLVVHWESDRSPEYAHTMAMAQSAGYLADGLLIARSEFGNSGLLVHLHTLFDRQRERFLVPILNTFLTSTRSSRLLDPVSLVEFIRTLTPSPVQRP